MKFIGSIPANIYDYIKLKIKCVCARFASTTYPSYMLCFLLIKNCMELYFMYENLPFN